LVTCLGQQYLVSGRLLREFGCIGLGYPTKTSEGLALDMIPLPDGFSFPSSKAGA